MMFVSIISLVSVLLLAFVVFLVVRKIMKIKMLQHIPFKWTAIFLLTIISLSVVSIIIGSVLNTTSSKSATNVFSRAQVAKILYNEQEETFQTYLKKEKNIQLSQEKLTIHYEGNEQANYYVQQSERAGKDVQIRSYVLPIYKQGYEIEEEVSTQRAVLTKQNKLMISTSNTEEIKMNFIIINTKFNRPYLDATIDSNLLDNQINRFTVIDVPKEVKVYYDVSESLRSEIYNE